jgi:4-amino-4-deoxy-L-arabinose transferase-like glycosyltransferase
MLATRALYDPDEGRYAEIPSEMLRGGDWIIPHLDGLTYLEKPPLQYWLTALSFRVFGETAMAARLCTGLAGFFSLLIVFFVGRRLWGLDAGLKAVLLTGASALFVLLGHQLTLDMLLSFWLLAALATFLLAQTERDNPVRCRQWMLSCWGAMALAVLTKGLIGVIVPGASLLGYALWQRDRQIFRELNVRQGLGLFAVIAAPWFVLAAMRNPEFLRFFFIREHFQRFLTPIAHRSEPWWFFIAVLAVGILPWLPQAISVMIATGRRDLTRGQFDPARLLWIWSAFIVVFFSCSDSKLVPYILPAVPALALLVASRPAQSDRFNLIMGAVLTMGASIGLIALLHSALHASKIGTVAQLAQSAVTGIAALLAIAGALSAILWIRKQEFAALTVLCGAWFLTSFGVLLAGTELQSQFSAKDMASALHSETEYGPVFSVQLYDQSLAFYLGRPVVLVDYRDEFALGLDQEPSRGIGNLSEFSARWRTLASGYAVMCPKTRDLLLAQGLPMREIYTARNRVVVSRR